MVNVKVVKVKSPLGRVPMSLMDTLPTSELLVDTTSKRVEAAFKVM